jgi:uncharacterized caspase-like protein
MLRAVVVGIDLYQDETINPLQFARKDAGAFADVLRDLIHPSDLALRVLGDKDASRAGILAAVDETLVPGQPDDLLLFYFAGHGTREVRELGHIARRYLVPHDTWAERIFSGGISLESELARWHACFRARKVIIILDACFSGAAGGRTFTAPQYLYQAATGSEPLRLAKLALGEGYVILAASGEDETAREDPALGHGVFTHYLLQELRRPSPLPTVSVFALFDRLFEAVVAHSSGKQSPCFRGACSQLRLPRFALAASASVANQR